MRSSGFLAGVFTVGRFFEAGVDDFRRLEAFVVLGVALDDLGEDRGDDRVEDRGVRALAMLCVKSVLARLLKRCHGMNGTDRSRLVSRHVEAFAEARHGSPETIS